MTERPAPVATTDATTVVAGVDTHSRTHHVAVLTCTDRELGDHEFPATAAGYAALLAWIRTHGAVLRIGVEGTGSYGAGLTRHLALEQVPVVEINRPDRRARRSTGKVRPARRLRRRPRRPRRGPGRDPQERNRDRRGHPNHPGDPPQRGQGPHPDHQPAPITPGHSPIRPARTTRRAEDTSPGERVRPTADRHR